MSTVSLPAEQALLGAMMLDNAVFWRVNGRVIADDFAKGEHRKLFEVIGELSIDGSRFDAVSLADFCEAKKIKAGGLSYIAGLANDTPGTSSAEAHAGVIADKAHARNAIAAIQQALPVISAGDIAGISDLQTKLESLHRTTADYLTFKQALDTGLASIDEAIKQRTDGVIGVPTGLPSVDRETGGLRGQKLIIMAARPSLGKTALALQWALHAAQHGHPVGFCSLEMGAEEIAVRSMANEYKVNVSALASGVPEYVSKLQQRVAGRNISGYPIFIDETGFSTHQIISRIAEWHRKHQIEMAIVDHLQLVDLRGKATRNDELGEVTRALKLTAKRLNIPILLLCQLNRNSEREGRRPRLSDLRDSGNIEQDADIVLTLHGELETDDGCRSVQFGFLKHRGGKVGWIGADFTFNGKYQHFSEVDTRFHAA